MGILHLAIQWAEIILKMTATYIFILMGPGIILAIILHYLHKHVEANAWALLGKKAYLCFFGGVGTMVHEIGHAIMCIPFGHKITEIKLFDPNPTTGTLGYVSHSYNPGSKWAQIGNFFIGIGPILIGSLVVCFSAHQLISETSVAPILKLNISYNHFTSLASFKTLFFEVLSSFVQLFVRLFEKENFFSWKFWAFLYVLVTVGSSMTLSPSDVGGAVSGFGTIVGLFMVISIGTRIFEGGINTSWLASLAGNYSVIYAVMLLAIGFNALILAPLFVLRKVFIR